MTAPTPRTTTVRSIDLRLGPGRQTLRVSLTLDPDGEPEALVLACGFGGGDTGDPFHRPPSSGPPMTLPAGALPALRAALDALEVSS